MTIRRLASICILIAANLLIGFFYLQLRRPINFTSNFENDTFLWNTSDFHGQGSSTSNYNSTTDVFPHPYKYIINNRDICSKESNGKLTLLILVCSAVHNFINRKAIRETWGSVATITSDSKSVRLGFLLGATNNATLQKLVENESLTHLDIIQENFYDAYRNLTLKSVMLLKWVSKYCSNVHFVLKTDDDMYVNVAKLITTLTRLPVKRKVMYGTLFRKAKPNRNPSAKWYVPKEQFQSDVFPDYLSGTGYVISRDVIPTLFEISTTLPFLVMEDVFITGLCASEASVRRYNVKGFAHWKRIATGCAFRDAITGHHVTAAEMKKIWSELKNKRFVCPLKRAS